SNRLSAIASSFPSLASSVVPPRTTVFAYDQDGNLAIKEDANDTEVFTKYDAIDRPIATRVFRNGQSDSFIGDPTFPPNPASDPRTPPPCAPGCNPPIVGTNKLDYQYDGLSRLVRGTANNDPTITTDDSIVTDAYDSLSRVIEETQQIGANPVAPIDYAW